MRHYYIDRETAEEVETRDGKRARRERDVQRQQARHGKAWMQHVAIAADQQDSRR